MHKIVILDRDGVINHDSDDYIRSPEEWLPIAGSMEAIAHLHRCGFRIFVVTNQSGVARKYFSADTLAAIHTKMINAVESCGGMIERIFYCPHHPHDNCECRKPKTGLIKQLETHLNFKLEGEPFVGDSLTDLQAARDSGCLPILVKTGKGQLTLAQLTVPLPEVFADLAAFTKWITGQGPFITTHPG